MKRNEIIKFCQEYLEADKFSDFCYNGLQVEGSDEVNKIITGVTFSQKLAQEAIKKGVQMILVHHGIFPPHLGDKPRIAGYVKDRLKLILENNINLAGFHLPLDAHPEIGNNISILKALGLEKTDAINSPAYGDIGFLGELTDEVDFVDFVKKVDENLKTKSYFIDAGKKVKRVGVISGGADNEFVQAHNLGADTYLTGKLEEHNVRAIEEVGINFINAGHYNTEVLGIKNLGKLLAEKFSLDVEFIDVPCDI